jgi:hypothetical protein
LPGVSQQDWAQPCVAWASNYGQTWLYGLGSLLGLMYHSHNLEKLNSFWIIVLNKEYIFILLWILLRT